MIHSLLIPLIDPKNALQTVKLIKTQWPVLGVSIPKLRTLAKTIVKENDQWMKLTSFTAYEEVLCFGFCIAYAKMPLTDKIKLLNQFLLLCDNWAFIDCVFGTIKVNEIQFDELWTYIEVLIKNEKEFYVRAGIILILVNFIITQYIDNSIEVLQSITSNYYYVNMALAWTYCEIVCKFPTKGIALIKQRTLPAWVQNKTIQKIKESFRVSNELKDELIKYKK